MRSSSRLSTRFTHHNSHCWRISFIFYAFSRIFPDFLHFSVLTFRNSISIIVGTKKSAALLGSTLWMGLRFTATPFSYLLSTSPRVANIGISTLSGFAWTSPLDKPPHPLLIVLSILNPSASISFLCSPPFLICRVISFNPT